jgi:hypothetical protein
MRRMGLALLYDGADSTKETTFAGRTAGTSAKIKV